MRGTISRPHRVLLGAIAVEAGVKILNLSLLVLSMALFYRVEGDILYILGEIIESNVAVPTLLQIIQNPPSVVVVIVILGEYALMTVAVLKLSGYQASLNRKEGVKQVSEGEVDNRDRELKCGDENE